MHATITESYKLFIETQLDRIYRIRIYM